MTSAMCQCFESGRTGLYDVSVYSLITCHARFHGFLPLYPGQHGQILSLILFEAQHEMEAVDPSNA